MRVFVSSHCTSLVFTTDKSINRSIRIIFSHLSFPFSLGVKSYAAAYAYVMPKTLVKSGLILLK